MERIDVEKNTNNSCIIDSGSIIIQNGDYVDFKILNLKYRVIFRNEYDNIIPSVETKIDKKDDNFMSVILYNQENSTFSGSYKKMHLGNFGDKKLWFLYSVLAINKRNEKESDKILFYTWMYDI